MKKIPTLFKREFEGHKIVGIKNEFTDEVCEAAFLYGKATLKIDGSCCAIFNNKFYKRYDAKKGKPIPEGAIKCQEEADPITGHLPCWVEVKEDNPNDKWFIRAFNFYKSTHSLLDGTYEAIGPHFQNNPYKLPEETLVKHGDIELDVKRTFEDVKKWLTDNYVEGIVFWLDGKPICKIKRSDFGLDWVNSKGH